MVVVGLGVLGRLGVHGIVLRVGHAQLLVVDLVLEHVLQQVDVVHDARFYRLEDVPHRHFGNCFRSEVGVFLVHAHHDAGSLGLSDDHGHVALGGVVVGEPGLEVSRSHIHDDGFGVFVHHV